MRQLEIPRWRRSPAIRDARVAAAPPLLVQPQQTPEFADMLRRLWTRRRFLLSCAAATAVLAYVVVHFVPSHYLGEARVLIGIQEPRIFVNKEELFLPNSGVDADKVQDESFLAQSRAVAQQVIDKLHLDRNPEFNPSLRPDPWARAKQLWAQAEDYLAGFLPAGLRNELVVKGPARPPKKDANSEVVQADRLVDGLLSKVNVSSLGRSHVLSIQADSRDPEMAAQIANAVAAAYLGQERQNRVNATNDVQEYLDKRVAELRQQVEKADQAVEDYRRQYGIYKGANTGLTTQQVTEMNTQLILAQTAKAEADSRLQEAMAFRRGAVSGESVPEVLNSPLIGALKQQQAEAQRKVAEYSSNYGERHPKVLDAKAALNDTTRKIQTEVSTVIAGLQSQARSADARYSALQRDFGKAQTKMGAVNANAIHLDALERDATVYRNLLENMLGRAKEVVGQQSIMQPNGRIISPAVPPAAPSYPARALITFLAGLGGLLAAIVVVILGEGVDRTFRRAEQIEQMTGLPVMALVPQLKGAMPPTTHVLRHPVSSYSEALRRIYFGLELSDPANPPKTVMFCSATPAEGKSIMVSTLGRLLASNGKRILLIDCDWRYPSLHRLFRCPNKGGLAALLTDETVTLNDCIYNDSLSGLDLIPAGEWTLPSIHMLTSERMRMILQTFAKNYDMVILDTPPVLVGAEVLTLSRMVDKVNFIVRWGHTPREESLDALKQLVEAQADLGGVVLSRVDPVGYRKHSYGPLNYEYSRPAALTRVE